MQRRDRQSEMVVALIVAIAMVFALIFAILLSLGGEEVNSTATPISQMPPDTTVTVTDIPPTELATEEAIDSTPSEPSSTPLVIETHVEATSAPTEEGAATESLATEVALATEAISVPTEVPTEEIIETEVIPTEEASVPTEAPTEEVIETEIIPTEEITAPDTASPTPSPTASRTRIPWQQLQTQVAVQQASQQAQLAPTETFTATFTVMPSETSSPSPTFTATLTLASSATPTFTATNLPSRTPSPSITFTPSPMPTLTTVALLQTEVPSRTPIPLAQLRTQTANGTLTQVATLASPTPVPCIPRTDWDIYVIDVGDTFYSIARRYGLSMEVLSAANCIPNLSLIYAGQPIRVPPGGESVVQGPDAGVEFCNTSDAVITAPATGTSLDGMVILRGVAQGLNFRRYILDWRPDDPTLDYTSFAEVFEMVPAEGVLGQFNTDAFPRGLYWFRLRVLETNDYIIGECAVRVRFR